MVDVPQAIEHQATIKELSTPLEQAGTEEMLFTFLNWLEQAQGLTLCHAFKPQFDWYTPAFANKEKLASEFFGTLKSIARKKAIAEH
jgi:hypothetical protein